MPLSSSLLIAVVSKMIFGFDDIHSVWTNSGAGSTNNLVQDHPRRDKQWVTCGVFLRVKGVFLQATGVSLRVTVEHPR